MVSACEAYLWTIKNQVSLQQCRDGSLTLPCGVCLETMTECKKVDDPHFERHEVLPCKHLAHVGCLPAGYERSWPPRIPGPGQAHGHRPVQVLRGRRPAARRAGEHRGSHVGDFRGGQRPPGARGDDVRTREDPAEVGQADGRQPVRVRGGDDGQLGRRRDPRNPPDMAKMARWWGGCRSR